jgi:hypothetical protein
VYETAHTSKHFQQAKHGSRAIAKRRHTCQFAAIRRKHELRYNSIFSHQSSTDNWIFPEVRSRICVLPPFGQQNAILFGCLLDSRALPHQKVVCCMFLAAFERFTSIIRYWCTLINQKKPGWLFLGQQPTIIADFLLQVDF